MPRNPCILLLIETSSSWGSGIVRGVHEWLADRAINWDVQLVWHGRHEALHVPKGWRGDGILARVTSEALARELRACKVPVVNVSTIHHPGIPQVTMDDRHVGRVAFDHLRGLGLRHAAYLGPVRHRQGYDDAVGPAFAMAAARATIPCKKLSVDSVPDTLEKKIHVLSRAIKRLPKPLGILAWGAEEGRCVLDAARVAGLRVPSDVSIVCGEDDALLCGITTPTLTAVDPGPRGVGAAAAKTLACMMNGLPAPMEPVLLPMLGMCVRGSTDRLAVSDPVLAVAIAFLRANVHRPIGVEDLARAAGVSRRTIELRFDAVLGRSPSSEIRRLKVEAAQRVLMELDGDLEQVARLTGFASAGTLRRCFMQIVGETPAAWRRRCGSS